MKRVDRSNDFVADVIVSEFPGQLEQAFVRFRAAVAEKDSPRRDKVDNPFRQPPLELIIIEIGDMDQLLRLLGQGFGHLGMGMA